MLTSRSLLCMISSYQLHSVLTHNSKISLIPQQYFKVHRQEKYKFDQIQNKPILDIKIYLEGKKSKNL